MRSQRILVALKLCALLVLLTAARAWPIVGPPPTASAAEVTNCVLTETLAPPSVDGARAAATPTPVAEMFLEGIIEASYFYGCPVLETVLGSYVLLSGDLQGFGIGDRVGVWANVCQLCISICSASGGIVTVKGIIGLESVGGVAELPRLDGGQAEVAGTPLGAGGSSGPGAAVLAGVATVVAAGAVALGGAAWWARRRA